MKQARILILALLGIVTCQGQVVSKSDWADNAQKIIQAHERNRSEQKFAEQLSLYNASIFLAYNEVSEKRPDRNMQAQLALIMYLNAKLYQQYVMDHPDSLKDKVSVARDMVKLYGGIFREYRTNITETDMNDFRQSFAGHPEFRLRSL